MANTYERLVAAGAPAIVEPLFYRIQDTYLGSLTVELRSRKPYNGTTSLGRRTVQTKNVAPAYVLEDVVQALRELVDAHELKDVVQDLVGDHAPEEAGK